MLKRINLLVTITVFVTLASGFTVNTSAIEVRNVEIEEKLDESVLGPCSRRGCEGKKSDCGGESYNLFEVGDIEVKRYCKGEKSEKDEIKVE